MLEALRGPTVGVQDFAATVAGSSVFFVSNAAITAGGVALRFSMPFRMVLIGDARAYIGNLFALTPLAWLMARVYTVEPGGWWSTLLFALPLYTTRVAHQRFMEMREMFTQTIGALAEAVDKRDPLRASTASA